MNKKLYDSLDWARIEGLVYSEENHPHDFLGAVPVEDGIRIQTYIPSAAAITVVLEDGSEYPMDAEDDHLYKGFFACLIPGKTVPSYRMKVTYEDGSTEELIDAYNFDPQIPEKELKKFAAGHALDVYHWLGAHPMTVNGVDGVYFAVWAPNAVRVSVVGDFVHWDGRRLPMRKVDEYGVFELFVPGLTVGTLYKYEVKAQGGLTFLKADPYGNQAEKAPDTASIVADLSAFAWSDQNWMEKRAEKNSKVLPVSVYELSFDSWTDPEKPEEPVTYRSIAPALASYVKKMGYTHVEFLPIMEYADEDSLGYKVDGYYAPTSRYGTPEDLMYLINFLHEKEIGVILSWVPTHFPKDIHGLVGFDGTDLYGHHNPKQARYAKDDSLCYNYARPQVANFLTGSALFWSKVFHADGLQLDDIATMLYLDYGKKPGEWIPNMYGGSENLDAVEFLKNLSEVYHKECPGCVLIAEDSSGWPKVTSPVTEEGLGIDYEWNRGFREGLLNYIQLDPIFRGPHHGELIFSMVYNYSEDFVLALPTQTVSGGSNSMYSRVPGKRKNKFANLRALYGYLFMHPGKKLLSAGQDIAQKKPLDPHGPLEWEALSDEDNQKFQGYCAALQKFYREHPALWEKDYDPEGFEWINNISANENMLVFLRRGSEERDMLLVVVNFSNLCYEDHKIGVPFHGKFKEIFNSDAESYGGDGNVNPRVKVSKKDECDELPDSIKIKVPPMGISVFSCTRADEPVRSDNEKAKATRTKKAGAKKSAAKANVKKESLKEELERKIREEG